MRRQRPRKRIAISRKTIIIGGMAAVLLVYGLWSMAIWRQYQEGYSVALAQAKTKIDTSLALPQSTHEDKEQKINAVSRTSSEIQMPNCRVNGLFDWQQVLGLIQTSKNDCMEVKGKIETLTAALGDVAKYLEDEQKIVEGLAVEALPEQIAENDLGAQVARWQSMRDAISALEVGEQAVPVKAKAQEATVAIFNAWQRLLDAHKAEDQAAYEDARTALAESYDALATIAPAGIAELTKLLQTFNAVYGEAFNSQNL